MDNQKVSKNTFQTTTFKVEKNSRTCIEIQGLFKENGIIKDFQGLFKTVQTLQYIVLWSVYTYKVTKLLNHLPNKGSLCSASSWNPALIILTGDGVSRPPSNTNLLQLSINALEKSEESMPQCRQPPTPSATPDQYNKQINK